MSVSQGLIAAQGNLHRNPLPRLLASMATVARNALRRGVDRRADRAATVMRPDVIPPLSREPWHGEVVDVRDRPAIALARPFARLASGSVVGITGPSGSGKTTMIERLVGLRVTPEAQIAVDGADITTIDRVTLGRCFAYAPQAAAPLAGTVREYLTLARGPNVEEAALWSALNDAALDKRVRRLPAGLDSWIGEGGDTLSDDENRRLGLARAYLGAQPWLLLDEPTAGLDVATEALIVARLRDRLLRTGQGALLVSEHEVVLAICTTTVHLGEVAATARPPRMLRAARALG
jgi:ATP-binding cassette subfamily C protein CydC